jgi:hypothetical protein
VCGAAVRNQKTGINFNQAGCIKKSIRQKTGSAKTTGIKKAAYYQDNHLFLLAF